MLIQNFGFKKEQFDNKIEETKEMMQVYESLCAGFKHIAAADTNLEIVSALSAPFFSSVCFFGVKL